MNVDSVFMWVEHSAVSTWIRESPSVFAFPSILFLHTLGMGFLAGTNAAMDLRILGFAPSLPLAPMERLFRIMWSAFCVSAASGIGLLIAYPTKAQPPEIKERDKASKAYGTRIFPPVHPWDFRR